MLGQKFHARCANMALSCSPETHCESSSILKKMCIECNVKLLYFLFKFVYVFQFLIYLMKEMSRYACSLIQLIGGGISLEVCGCVSIF